MTSELIRARLPVLTQTGGRHRVLHDIDTLVAALQAQRGASGPGYVDASALSPKFYVQDGAGFAPVEGGSDELSELRRKSV